MRRSGKTLALWNLADGGILEREFPNSARILDAQFAQGHAESARDKLIPWIRFPGKPESRSIHELRH